MSLIPKKGTVYVVDDDEAVRDSLQWLLEGKDYRVRCFESAESFLSRYDAREVACLIVDIRMGGMTGLELQSRLIEVGSPLPIVFITGHGDVPMAVLALRAGAMDFIEKPFDEDVLLDSVRRALEASLRHHMREAANSEIAERLDSLTTRERQVLDGLLVGRANKIIAHELDMSTRTVEVHRAHIMQKMRARSLSELVRLAISVKPAPESTP